MVNLHDIEQAKEIVQEVAHLTPLDYSQTMSQFSHNHIYLKLENMQKTGSFKIRGAYNKIKSLQDEEKEKGVIAASAGNHAQGVALGAAKAHISSTVVMPEDAPLAKAEATRSYGAKVVLHGHSFDSSLEYAQILQQKTGATFVHAFDDQQTIAGQGTIGLEILEQMDNIDAIVCPIGGGGLISGIATAVKNINPKINIYGVQAKACPSMTESLKSQCPTTVDNTGTIADGIAVKRPGTITYDLVHKYVDDIAVVDDWQISRAMLFLLERNKLLVEGSGAAAMAALLHNKLPLQNKRVAVIVSGGNVDIHFISRIIERGLIEAGRFFTISTTVPDKPGNLHSLLNIMAKQKANVIAVEHHRMRSYITPGQTEIELSIETRDFEHMQAIEHQLKQQGYQYTRKI